MEYFTIGEFAKYCGTTVEFLKFYDREGLLSPIGRDESGHRCYASYQTVDLAELYKLSRFGFSLKEAKRLYSSSSLDEFESNLTQRRDNLKTEIDSQVAALAHLEGLLAAVKNVREEDNWIIQSMEAAYFCLPNPSSTPKAGPPWWKLNPELPEIWQRVSWSPSDGISPQSDSPVRGYGWGSILYDRQKIDSSRYGTVVSIPAGRCFLYWYSVQTEYDCIDSHLSENAWSLEKPLSIMAAHSLVPHGDIYKRQLFITHKDGRPFLHFMVRIKLR